MRRRHCGQYQGIDRHHRAIAPAASLWSILEETLFDASGRVANATFGDYLIPVNADISVAGLDSLRWTGSRHSMMRDLLPDLGVS